jgi:protein TonB
MLDTMLESTGKRIGKRTLGPVGLSAAVHVTIVGLVVGVSYLVVEAVQDPPDVMTFVSFTAAMPQGSAPPLPPLAKAESKAPEVEPEIDPEEILQPIEVPDEVPTGPETAEREGSLDGVSWGEPGGVPSGVRDGVLGGGGDGEPGGVGPGGPGGTGDEPIIVCGTIVPPRLVYRLRPEYPELARKARLPGRVVLQAVIAKDGTVVEVSVLRSDSSLFEDAAVQAVKQWRYEPALSGGQPVAVYFTVVVEFRLE